MALDGGLPVVWSIAVVGLRAEQSLGTPQRNGAREPFKREKLLDGLVKACEKRPVSIDILEDATDEIISEIQSDGLREIPTQSIGARVMQRLQEIDPVAYVRYASVYRQFQEVGEFIEEIESLEKEPIDPRLQPELFESGHPGP